jgi:hypothetical protein
MKAFRAALKGLLRVLSSPVLVLWLWLTNFVVALPMAYVMTRSIESSIGGSLVSESLRSGFDMGWFGEYEAQAKGLETSFSPSVTGVGAFLDNWESWFNGNLFVGFPGLVAFGILYSVLWALFLGGILNQLREGAGIFRLSEFLSQGATFFFRFLRLAVLSGLLYYLVYRFSGWLFGWIEQAVRDVTVERTVLAYVLAGALLVGFLLTFVNMAFDYAKIATFRENRRSMLFAAVRGFRFVLTNPFQAAALYYGLGLAGVLLLVAYSGAAPGVGQGSTPTVIIAFLVGQAFLIAKLVLRLTFYAGQTRLYEIVSHGR